MFALAWLVAAAAYLLFAGHFSAEELVAAAAIGALGAAWWSLVHRTAEIDLQLKVGAAGAMARAVVGLPLASLRASGRLVAIIFGAKGGRIVAEPFDTGRQNDAAEVGRRAVALLAASVAPDSFVVRVDKEAHLLRSHVILSSPSPADPRWGR